MGLTAHRETAFLGTERAVGCELDERLVEMPKYLPSNRSTLSRPVTTRATRIASVLACEADSVNCHNGSAYRRVSSSATTIASSVGSRNWFPFAMRSATARTTGSGA